jgi:cellulose 1,4-beta-cellobiosidase
MTKAAIVPLCEQYGTVEIINKTYAVQNNAWNWNGQQCLDVDNESGSFIVTASNANQPTNDPKPATNAPASYPSVYTGCHWGHCTSGSEVPLPIQVSNIVSANTSWSTIQPDTGVYKATYDIWFNKSAAIPSGQPDGAELMICLRYQGSIKPKGDEIASAVPIAGETWDVWVDSSNIITYVKTTGTTSVSNLNLLSFFSDAVFRGVIHPDWYLMSIEAGFEIWQGGTGLQSSSYSVMVNAPMPVIEANGAVESVTVPQSTPVSITVALDPVAQAGRNADWWIVSATPFGLFSYVYPSGWIQNIDLAVQTHLFTLPAFEVLNMNLPVGDYTFFFGVDMTPNRKLDSPLYYNAVQVHVTP